MEFWGSAVDGRGGGNVGVELRSWRERERERERERWRRQERSLG